MQQYNFDDLINVSNTNTGSGNHSEPCNLKNEVDYVIQYLNALKYSYTRGRDDRYINKRVYFWLRSETPHGIPEEFIKEFNARNTSNGSIDAMGQSIDAGVPPIPGGSWSDDDNYPPPCYDNDEIPY